MEEEYVQNDIGRLRAIAQQPPLQQAIHLLPLLVPPSDRSMELFHQLMIDSENGERDFKEMIEEFVRIIEKKLTDAQCEMFDST